MEIYLDHNATSPLDRAAEQAMAPFARDVFGNPASVHRPGRLAAEALEAARASLAAAIGALSPWRLVFTSGGTEALQLAILGVAYARGGGHFVSTAVEHPAVVDLLAQLAGRGYGLTVVEVDRDGRLAPERVAAACRPDTILIAAQWANNEIGTVQPVAALAEVALDRRVPLLVDAVQALGRLPVDLGRLAAQLVAFSGHKVGGPKGVGVLAIRDGVELAPLFCGGGQEGGLRGGTVNVAGAVGLAVAAERAVADQPRRERRWLALREDLLAIAGEIRGVRVVSPPTRVLPNTVSLSFDGVDAAAVMLGLAERGIAVSAGSACGCRRREPSRVLAAVGHPDPARGAVRFSMGPDTTAADLQSVRAAVVTVVERLRAEPEWGARLLREAGIPETCEL